MLLLLGSLGLLLGPRAPPRGAPRAAIVAALDYKDPVVAEEFQACQALDTEAVEDELAASGIPVPPTMNDMEMRMMLVEMRLRKSGKVGPQKAKPKAKPGADASAFEVALYEKPAFSELYEEWKAARNTNAANLAIEHVNNARRAKERYGGTALYDETIAKIEAALNARVVKEVKGGALSYAGFPANMGEAGVHDARRLRRPQGLHVGGGRRRPHVRRHRRVRGRRHGEGGDRQVRRDGHGPWHDADARAAVEQSKNIFACINNLSAPVRPRDRLRVGPQVRDVP